MKMIGKMTALALLASTMAVPAMADDMKSPVVSRAPLSTQDFVKNATVGNNFEVLTSKLALQKTKDAKIKSFANKMIADHSMVGKNIKPVLSASNLEGAVPDDKLDEKHQAVYDDLKNTSAANFDAKYLAAQEDAHVEAIALFKDYSMNGGDANLKKFAGDTLPHLEEHQKLLGDLHSKK